MRPFIDKYRYILLIAFVNFLIIFGSAFNTAYGFFIDEWYYLACAQRPAFGYVDHPPLAPFILTIFTTIFGKSLFAVRFLPALAASVTVFLTAKLTERLGGKTYAQILAALAMMLTPVALAFGSFYSMNVFEPLLAILLLLKTLDLIETGKPTHWISFGVLMGLGMMNKHTFFVTILTLFAALIIAGQWRLFLTKWFLAAVAIAALIFLPNILWQMANGYPSLEFYRNITVKKNVYTPPMGFIIGQIMNMSAGNVPIWLAGTFFLLLKQDLKKYRFLGYFFLLTFLFMLFSHTSRSDRTLFAYPAAYAGGALFFEQLFERYKAKFLKYIIPFAQVSFLAVSLPLILPYFPYETVARQVKMLGLNTEMEVGKKPPLPQIIADRIGWKEKADLVQRAIQSLPPEEQKQIILTTNNYGKAGTLEYYADELGCDKVFCGHNTYYLWGRGKLPEAKCVVSLEDEGAIRGYKRIFDSVAVYKERYNNPYVSSHENNLVVIISRNPRMPLNEAFDEGKFYY